MLMDKCCRYVGTVYNCVEIVCSAVMSVDVIQDNIKVVKTKSSGKASLTLILNNQIKNISLKI